MATANTARRRRLDALRERLGTVDSGQGLDSMIEKTDVKLPGLEPLVRSGRRSKPRQPFSNPGMPIGEVLGEKLAPRNLPRLLRTMVPLTRNMSRSSAYYDERFRPRSDTAGPEFYAELEALATRLGASSIGYVTGIGEEEIFAGKAIPHDNAIVFTVEMDREPIGTAPSADAFIEVARGYKNLAIISNALTELLHSRGFAGYPGTALGGLTDYCALAERAGLGAIGYHGLLISPHDGARLRINSIYTNLVDLPVRTADPHTWIRDFCALCRNCVRSCPPGAIRNEPREEFGSGRTCIDVEACRPYFAANNGCAVCVKVCPFSNVGYEAVKERFTAAGAEGRPELVDHDGARAAAEAARTTPLSESAGPVGLPMPAVPPRAPGSAGSSRAEAPDA